MDIINTNAISIDASNHVNIASTIPNDIHIAIVVAIVIDILAYFNHSSAAFNVIIASCNTTNADDKKNFPVLLSISFYHHY